MTSQSTSNSLIAALCGLLTLNIYTLLPLFISIPPSLDLRLATLYVLALQGLISLAVVRLFYIATRRAFRLRCRRTLVLMLLYAVFPVPRLAIWVLDSVVPGICVRKGFSSLPKAKHIKTNPARAGEENASVYFVGNATTILDHFDEKVEASLRRDLPIITTSHAKSILTSKGADSFQQVFDLEPFEHMMVNIKGDSSRTKQPHIRVTGMPGKHIPTNKVVEKLNEFVAAIPPTNGWMVELGYGSTQTMQTDFEVGYRIYISGDTLMVDELKEIPRRFEGQKIDLMLIHLGGTTVPHPKMWPLTMMVTMDAKQGVELVRLIKPDLTIPIHFDDYDVFASSLEDFKIEMQKAGLAGQVVYLDRKEAYRFQVRAT
ncbi:hypothetical protein CNMCM8980_002351 [Aspergillus fumigatiaffinis]|uniref:Metallo-beta-lactamase domain-containing protein n=1 Tax=Aspergillus fumigatiaffinis TaxID=340414 RepID=A0A8H4ME30_9EURO|nr:hypothetical protein CNMCM6457_005427 [Aspergillus fumigatiaffinis]KAF4243754.1 hypothetical protein CNMCM6805_000477 [Aspergillus fumigatiaffinis]KAF4250026.1 hypothetical protein CNMCM8980_002351 [Aspergillus fumigatiaffinis]